MLTVCLCPCICCVLPFIYFTRKEKRCTRPYHDHRLYQSDKWSKKYGGMVKPTHDWKPKQQPPHKNFSDESLVPQPTTNSFLRLPLEIRMLVYKALCGTKRIGKVDESYSWLDTSMCGYPSDRIESRKVLGLCKQIYLEAIPIIYQETKFLILHEGGFTDFVNSIHATRFRDIRQLLVSPDMIQEPFCQFIGRHLDLDHLRLQVMLSSDSLYPETRWLKQLETMPYCERLNLEIIINTSSASIGIRGEAASFMKILRSRLDCQPKLIWYRPTSS